MPVEPGAATPRIDNRIDIAHALSDPRFWAVQLGPLLVTDQDAIDPEEKYFGFDATVLNTYYRELIHQQFDRGLVPFIRIAVDESRFVEIEFTAGAEYQDRFWIGTIDAGAKTLMGYYSVHASLPAFRIDEIQWLLHGMSESRNHRFALMLLTACNLTLENDALAVTATLSALFAGVPGVQREHAHSMAAAMFSNIKARGLQWECNPEHGWINNHASSQRNPASPVSTLSKDDYAAIHAFFNPELY